MSTAPDIPPRADLQRRFVAALADPSARRTPVSAAELREAEDRLRVVLPAAHAQFLLEFGPVSTPALGGRLLGLNSAGPDFPDVDGLLGPAAILAANCHPWLTPVPWHVSGLAGDATDDVFKYVVAFAMDGGGNFVCFPRSGVANDDLPVLLFDHDLGGLHQVAPSFDEFLWWYVEHLATGPACPVAVGRTEPPAPLLGEVRFTQENDHNPTYAEKCDRCGGYGRLFVVRYDRPRQAGDDLPCPDCGATGWVRRRRFNNDSPTVEADVGADGWLTCPHCRRRFTIRDRNAWTGYRHKGCGQRIRLRNV